MSWQWRSPDGRMGYACATEDQAILSAIQTQLKRAADLDAGERRVLWSSLVRAGWQLMEL